MRSPRTPVTGWPVRMYQCGWRARAEEEFLLAMFTLFRLWDLMMAGLCKRRIVRVLASVLKVG